MNPPCEEMSPVYRHLQQSKNSYIYPESLRFSTTLIKHVSTPIHTPLLTKYYPDNQCSICSNKPQVLPRITCASSFSPVFSSPLIPALFALSDPFLSSYPLQSLTGVITTQVQLAKKIVWRSWAELLPSFRFRIQFGNEYTHQISDISTPSISNLAIHPTLCFPKLS